MPGESLGQIEVPGSPGDLSYGRMAERMKGIQPIEHGQGCGLPFSEKQATECFRETVDYWRQWVSRCSYTGRWREMVHRSALVLKLLTFEPTGAIVAAPTCSLPEAIGGPRNWDYRYVWIRDAAFTVYALMWIGFHDEAARFMEWVLDRCRQGLPTGRRSALSIRHHPKNGSSGRTPRLEVNARRSGDLSSFREHTRKRQKADCWRISSPPVAASEKVGPRRTCTCLYLSWQALQLVSVPLAMVRIFPVFDSSSTISPASPYSAMLPSRQHSVNSGRFSSRMAVGSRSRR